MKKRIVAVIAMILCLCFAACSAAGTVSPSSSEPAGNTAAQASFGTVEELLTDRRFNPSDVWICTGSITDEVVLKRELGDVRVLDVKDVIHGEITAVNLSQMFTAQRLRSGETYLLLLAKRQESQVENDYEVVADQGAFWIENGKLCGNDPKLVEEILQNFETKEYTVNGNVPDVNTLEGLAEYFTARLEALK